MVLSSLWFGGLHLTNALLGTPPVAVAVQVCLAAIQGMTLYQFRRATGWLVPAMIVHGLWDISVFLPTHPAKPGLPFFEPVALLVMVIAGLVSGYAVVAHGRARAGGPLAA